MRVAAVLVGVLGLVAAGVVLIYRGSPPGPASLAADKAPHYIEQAVAAGVSHAYEGDFEYFVGGGVAAFDCNSDGLPELYIAGGSAPAALFVNRSAAGGALRFDPQASPATDLTAVVGAYPIDIDGDGVTDLVVLRRNGNVLLRGLGDCRFEGANRRWSFDGGANNWSTAFSAKWDPGSAWPTIAVGNYLAEESSAGSISCADNQLFTPAANGAAFAPYVALSPGWCTLSLLFSDWDRTGRRDLRVTNDRHYYSDASAGEEQLWRVASGQPPRAYGADDGWRTVRVFGMGIASFDITGDGFPDYYLTSQGDNKLQALADGPAQPTYEDVALRRGVTATRPYEGDTTMASTAWHDEFADVNNDGLIDLYVSKGNVEAQPDLAARDPSNLLMGQVDGTFVEGAMDAGIVDYARARGAAVVDLNNDGLLDLVAVVRRENVRLYRNVGRGSADAPVAMGNWMDLQLAQAGGNRDAIGAWLEARVGERSMLRELTVGGGHASGQLGFIHFGLGAATSAQVRVTWPDGEVGPWLAVAANQRLLIHRDAAAPQVLP
jgi:hypothetical protein